MLIQIKSFINSLSPVAAGRALGIDISHNQELVDWELIKPWVDFAVIKCMDVYSPDHHFVEHYDGAIKANLPLVGVYMWYDPLLNPKKQAEATMAALDGRKPAFIALDIEQWWANWNLWLQRRRGDKEVEVPVLGDNQITPGAKVLYDELRKLTNIPLLPYTSAGFANSYTKTLSPWLVNKVNWFAQYPWNIQSFDRTKAKTWGDFIKNVLPLVGSGPVTPRGVDAKNWSIWQFSGDYFSLPGIYGRDDKSRLSNIDFNVFNGTIADMKKLFGAGDPALPIPVIVPSHEEKVEIMWTEYKLEHPV